MTEPKVTVIIVSYNTREVLARCLSAIDSERYEVIVVDNDSNDQSPDLVREKFTNVELIEAGRNLGFGAANNLGFQHATGDYYALINSDAWAVDDGLEKLTEVAASDAELGIVGPRLVGSDGSIQKSVRTFPTVWRLCTEYFFLRHIASSTRIFNAFYGSGFDYAKPVEADWLMGAVLVLRRELIEDIGGFDERFFLFSEEADLCYRAREAGWKVFYTPDAEFVHLGGASTGANWGLMYREQLRGHILFLEKHIGCAAAESARRWLIRALFFRSLVFRSERGRIYRSAARWLMSESVSSLLRHSL